MDPPDPGNGSEQHFVGLLGLRLWADQEGPRGRSTIRPSMWVPGTNRPRLGILATMVDMIGGIVPEGLVTPTIDLRISTVGELPSDGDVDLECTITKFGQRFLVSETLLRNRGRLFARGTTTFLSEVRLSDTLLRDDQPPEIDIASFDALIAPNVLDDRTLELVPRPGLNNGMRNTVQGGVQATFCEMVTEHALGGSARVTDIDIRYLRGMKVGPMHGTAEVLGASDGLVSVRVLLTDAGADDRLISYSAVTAVQQ